MKNLLTPGRNLAVPLLLGFWGCVYAQSLGTPSAEVLLGRPLEMSVPARFDAADKGDECVHADVFYGETRVRADQVRATVTGPNQQRRIRVEAATPIDEPVVTVSVRAGCRNTVTRNYTLLPEYPSEPLLAAIEARTRTAAATVPPVPGAVPSRVAQAPAARTSPRIAGPRPLREVVAEAAAAVKAQAPAAKAPAARAFRQDAPTRGPRLKLEPLEALEPEARTLLRSTGLLAEPNGDESRRATAALLWKAINADPQEILRTSAMLQKLESDLAQLRKATGQTQAEMAALRQRLDQAQPWYVSAGVVSLLAALVLAAATAAGVLWWRTRRFEAREPWYVPDAVAPAEAAAVAAVEEPVAEQPPLPAAAERAPPLQPQVVRPMPVPAAVPVAVPAPRILEPMDFELPAAAEAAQRPQVEGVLRVETLADTFQDVEFLCSLGLAGDAMDVLKSYLQDSSSPAPLAFFELMRLCEQDEDTAGLAKVRRRYAQAFGVEAPPLRDLAVPLGLESLPELSARITRAWGTPEAPRIIEQTLFSVPAPGVPLTLQAGRDLICLYDVALALENETPDVQLPGSEADAHPLAPWAHADDPASAQAVAQGLAEAQGGHRFALDVDLTVPPQALPDRLDEPTELELAPLLAELKAAAARDEKMRVQAEAEDAFSAAMASERMPVSRF